MGGGCLSGRRSCAQVHLGLPSVFSHLLPQNQPVQVPGSPWQGLPFHLPTLCQPREASGPTWLLGPACACPSPISYLQSKY